MSGTNRELRYTNNLTGTKHRSGHTDPVLIGHLVTNVEMSLV